MTPPNNIPVALTGTPAAVGRAFAEVNGGAIARELAAFVATIPGGREALLRSTASYRALVARLAPHWLEEAAALAAGSGVEAELYLGYQGAKYRGINRPECFTWALAPRASGAPTWFHKNRDQQERPQAAFVKALTPGGSQPRHRFLAVADTTDLGVMMGVNEHGVAIAADMGHEDPHPRHRGMMNPDLLRLALEQAADVATGVALLRDWHEQGVYAGGTRATYWMLADRHGAIRRIYQFHQSWSEADPRDGLATMRDNELGDHVRAVIQAAGAGVDEAVHAELSRTAPVIAATTLSGLTVRVPATHAAWLTRAEVALYRTDLTLYVPLYLGVAATPRLLLDGGIYQLSKAVRGGQQAALRAAEAELRALGGALELAVAARLASGVPGDREAAIADLTAGNDALVTRAAELLRALA